MCKYCNKQNDSIFYNKKSDGIREIVIEQDGTLTINSNDYNTEDAKKSQGIGFSSQESRLMAQYNVNIKINYCPMCGRKLKKR